MAESSLGALLRNRRYRLYLGSRLSLILATQMLSVAVGWHIYDITHEALSLGFSGLALFLPGVVFALPAGHIADRYDRRRIIMLCHLGIVLAASTLALFAFREVTSLLPIYGVLAVLGTIRAFSGPSGQALMPTLVPREHIERAVALGSSSWQLAMIGGPSMGGVIYAMTGRPGAVYVASAVLAFGAFLCILAIGSAQLGEPRKREPASFETLVAGIHYVWTNKAILGAISLDLFAVLLGGAVALLPIYAKDILHIGPWGLGMLRSAPAVGAAVVALTVAYFPLRRHAGLWMFACVFIFGIATIVFGTSKSFGLSLAALVTLGAADMVSVVVRSTLIQMRTPNAMRGRVGAVELVFIGASNELGEFESGVAAAALGPVSAVLLGGIGTCVVVVLWALMFPALRKVDRLSEIEVSATNEAVPPP